MPTKTFESGYAPEVVCPNCLVPGTVPWLLARFRDQLFPPWLFIGWRGQSPKGRKAWPAVILIVLLILRWEEEGMSRRGSLRRANADLQWRAAMGLPCNEAPPDEKTLREFEAFLRSRHPEVGQPRFLVSHCHIVRLCKEHGVVGDGALWTTDSTPMWCYGAVLDTVRLLGDGLRLLGKQWARAQGISIEEVAKLWDLPLLLAKSTKGAFAINWRDPDARAKVVSKLANQALRIVDCIRCHIDEVRSNKRKGMLRKCRRLLRVVSDDLETDEEGRLVIAKKVARDRLVSFTEPQARHGRKTEKRTFNGFKLHLVGDLVSGLIAAVAVGLGNEHDSRPAHRLIGRAKTLFEDITKVLADTAYGGAELRHVVKSTVGVELLTPPPLDNRKKTGRLKKQDFKVDFVAETVTCPHGVTTGDFILVWNSKLSVHIRRYKWPQSACRNCPLREKCLYKKQASCRVELHPFERELRQARADWEKEEVRAAYRARTQCERLVNELVRHGGRRARAWGLGAAQLQAHSIVMRCNLRLLAKLVATQVEWGQEVQLETMSP